MTIAAKTQRKPTRRLGVRRAGRATVFVSVLGAAASVLGAFAAVQAQGKDLSDESVKVLMNYAWAMTPVKFTRPDGLIIEVDKSKRDEVVVPIEQARNVIRVARLSAYAQICGLTEEQSSNFQTMMAREQAKKSDNGGEKWTKQQLLYINQLHLFTVMTLTGKLTVMETEGEGDKEVVVEEKAVGNKKAPTCSDTERDKVKEQIKAFVAAEAAPANSAAPTATKAAETKKP
jgi:hypothetical protein